MILFFCIFLDHYAPCSFYFYICCATVLTLGLKSRVYGDPYEINDDDDDNVSIITFYGSGVARISSREGQTFWGPKVPPTKK